MKLRFLKNAVFALLLCITNTARANIELHIYLNTNQCVNCNLALNCIGKLAPGVVKRIYFPLANKAASEEMMEGYGDVKNLAIRYFDKTNDPFNSPYARSYCLLYNNKFKADSFELNELFEKVGGINKLTVTHVQPLVIPLPDSVKLSNRSNLFYYEGRLCITDYLLNKAVVVSLGKTQNNLAGILQIKGKSFHAQPFLRSGIVDTAAYRILYRDLKELGKTKPHIETCYLTDSALYLYLVFPCAIVRPVEKDTGIGGKAFIYKKNLFSRKSELFPVKDDALPSTLKEEYYVASGSAFAVHNNNFYFTLYQEQLRTENNFMAEYGLNGRNQLVFKKLSPYLVSDSTYLNTNFGNTQVFLTMCNRQFLFAQFQPVFVELGANHSYMLGDLLSPGSLHKIQVYDVQRKDRQHLAILIDRNHETRCVIYNTETRKIEADTKISVPQNANTETMRFAGENRLVALNNDNKTILFFNVQ